MSWRDEFQTHQEFAEAICWLLAMHVFRGKRRNNPLVPPSLQDAFFQELATQHGPGPQAVLNTCFPAMDESSFDDFWYGRSCMDLVCWKVRVMRLRREGLLAAERADAYMRRGQHLDWAHTALVSCRSALNRQTWDKIVERKGYMLFSWPIPGQPAIRQMLTQRQRRPWSLDTDYLDRHPRPDCFLPTERMTAVDWWPDRCPLVWQIALTPYPLPFDAQQPSGPAQWAVRLHVDPFEEAMAKVAQEPRYQRKNLPPEWGSGQFEQTLEALRARYPMFARP